MSVDLRQGKIPEKTVFVSAVALSPDPLVSYTWKGVDESVMQQYNVTEAAHSR